MKNFLVMIAVVDADPLIKGTIGMKALIEAHLKPMMDKGYVQDLAVTVREVTGVEDVTSAFNDLKGDKD